MSIVRIALAGTDGGNQGAALRLSANEWHEARLAAVFPRLRRATFRVEVPQWETSTRFLFGIGLAVAHAAEVGYQVVHRLLQCRGCCADESE